MKKQSFPARSCCGWQRPNTGVSQATFYEATSGGEAGNFPAAIKATTEYFPRKNRAFATGIFYSEAQRLSLHR